MAPGPDKITYEMLRNTPDNKLDELLRHINEVWATGELPEEWKEAHVIMLPKPGKLPNTLANLRPISKTVMYSNPYTQLTQTQKRKIKAGLRKCHRLELGKPKYAATALVNATAIHNALEEKSEIQQEAQTHRLTTSQQGRNILSKIPTPPPPWESIPHLTVRPIPKHMHPEVDSERRKSRATHLKDPGHDIYYTYASFTTSNATTASVGVMPTSHR
ncbi:hypothetical protein HPB47_003963 [Ixodes persulcatus]|uniref:Uncharacterized protein n=1 Tax=Ixodes persulcatus TaxID=34615 RepID=A0AC60PH20_IXOPE|nr:hypothetical protein HPB47_003963 [Ixodes persulcatus]